jgi:hypothetical protein
MKIATTEGIRSPSSAGGRQVPFSMGCSNQIEPNAGPDNLELRRER